MTLTLYTLPSPLPMNYFHDAFLVEDQLSTQS
jgi:hypothetical protein